ncbi:hypothetical protein O181_062441 [Austropuccinia psidii MF-1]|uniref:Mediator of RNA polymerase II transcription subunit 11 n=1 Tax=Austropuccinia psidii MF-1 TaxID=1389203 RepID=A0A9Q3EPS2_9BASI|nr:hypothetical protein [Austropuccinia psidii MF-1]
MVDTTHDSENSPASSSNRSDQRIKELGMVEEQLAKLLSLAGLTLQHLTPPDDEQHSSTTDGFSNVVAEYFETLNQIQLGLRTSMSHLRAARISTRILFEPVHTTIPNCPVGLGNLSTIASPVNTEGSAGQPSGSHARTSLSLASLVAERDAWKDLVDSLEQIKSTRGAKQSGLTPIQ